MRITRSGLRKIIAEERARILAEMKKKKPAWQVAAEEGGKDCLYILYGGRSVYYIVAPSGLTEEEAEAQAIEVTGDIAGDEEMANPLELYEWLANHDFITAVHDPESVGGEVSKAAFMAQLREVGEEEGLFASDDDEFVNEGEEVHEADKGPSPLAAAEGRLRAAIKDIHPTKASSLTKRVLDLIDDVMMEEATAAEADGTDEFPFNASVRVLEQMGDTFPGDADLEELHAAIDAVIKPQWRGALQNAAEAESDRRDVEDTERDLSHPSRFLEEGDDDALDEYGDPNDSDPDGGYMGFMASDDEMNYLRGGGSYSDSPYADLDVPDNRYTRGRAKGFNREPRVRGDDIDSGYDDDIMGDDNLSEGEDLSESIDMLSAGIGAIVGIAALYAAGPLSRVAYNILDELSFQQQQAARAAASKEAGSKLAAAIENLSHDKDLIALFKELEDLQKSEEKGASAKISKKSKEITAYIKGKRKDMSFGSGDEQDVRRGVSKRLKKGEDDKGDKLDEARWAKLAGILKG